jgi:unsaturated rhamnogalacturonyl hydrolase
MVLLAVARPAPADDSTPATQPAVPDAELGSQKVVGLDYYYNHQVKNGVQFHYIWDDKALSGYSKFGDVWKQYGATLATVPEAPTPQSLSHLSIYIIVNPSTVKNAADHKPNYIEEPAITDIVNWVNGGGVLAIFANDKNNCEMEHLNHLTQRFGIVYNNDLRNAVPTHADMIRGTFSQFPDVPLFKDVKMMYVKEISTITVSDPAQALLTAPKEQGDGTDIIIATSHYGKGFVFAIGDPWFYNEYIDVKTPDLPIENRKAANNLVKWLLSMAQASKA